MPQVIIYDTDFLNPYGRELALQLSPEAPISYIGAKAMAWQPDLRDARFSVRLSADGAVKATVGLSAIGHAFASLLRVLRGDTLVVLWARSVLECLPIAV